MNDKQTDGSFLNVGEIFVVVGTGPTQIGEGIVSANIGGKDFPCVSFDRENASRMYAHAVRLLTPGIRVRMLRFIAVNEIFSTPS